MMAAADYSSWRLPSLGLCLPFDATLPDSPAPTTQFTF
jgi:hypothetical protein